MTFLAAAAVLVALSVAVTWHWLAAPPSAGDLPAAASDFADEDFAASNSAARTATDAVADESQGRGPSVAPPPEPAREAQPGSVWIDGRLVFEDGARWEPGLRIRALAKNRVVHHTAPVTEDGRFRLAFPEDARRGALELDACCLRLKSERRLRLGAAGEEPVEVPVLPAAGLTVQLRDEEGTFPESERSALVVLYGEHRLLGAELPEQHMKGVPDETGRAEFRALPLDYDWIVGVDLQEHVDVQPGAGPRVELSPGKVTSIDVPLETGAQVEGRVVDSSGGALAGWTVSFVLMNQGFGLGASSTQTDSQGRFVLEGLPSKDASYLFAEGPHGAEEMWLEPLVPGEVRRGVLIEVETDRLVSGVVRLPDGSPAAGCEMHASRYSWGPMRCGPDGTFEIEILDDAEEVSLLALLSEHPRYGPLSAVLSHSGRAAVAIDLVEAPMLTLRVPALGGKGDVQGHLQLNHQLGLRFGKWVTLEAGTLQVPLAPGEWTLALTVGGLSTASVTVSLPRTDPIELSLPETVRVRGVVRFSTGKPASGAIVTLEVDDVTSYVETSADGSFACDLPPGQCVGRAEWERLDSRFERTVDGNGQVWEVELEPTGSIVGTLGVAEPKAGRRVVCEDREDPDDEAYLTLTDPDGRFRLDDLPVGPYLVALQPAGVGAMEGAARLYGTEVRVEEGKEQGVVLSDPTNLRRLEVRVVAYGGPAPYIPLSVFLGAATVSDQTNFMGVARFVVPPLPEYSIRVGELEYLVPAPSGDVLNIELANQLLHIELVGDQEKLDALNYYALAAIPESSSTYGIKRVEGDLALDEDFSATGVIFNHIPPGLYTVVLGDHHVRGVRVADASRSQTTWTLGELRSIHGRIEGVPSEFTPSDDDDLLIELWDDLGRLPGPGIDFESDEGDFTISAPPGRYTVRAEWGSLSGSVEVDTTVGDAEQVRVPMK